MPHRLSFRQAKSRIGLSTSDAARLLKVSRSTIWRWEKGLQKPVRHAEQVKKLIGYASRLKKKAVNVDHRIKTLERILKPPVAPTQVAPPKPLPEPPLRPRPLIEPPIEREPLPEPPHDGNLSYVDIHQYLAENAHLVDRLIYNGKEITDTPLGWINDHAEDRETKAVNEGDLNRYWRITTDYNVRVEGNTLFIDFAGEIA